MRIYQYLNVNYHGQKWFNCDSWGFVSGLKDAGLQKDQGDEVLDVPARVDSPKPKQTL